MNLKEFAAVLEHKNCQCGHRYSANELRHYEHGGGWQVDNLPTRQWLYAECGSCEYQTSLDRLGVSGSDRSQVVSM